MGPIDYSGAFSEQNPAQAFAQWFNVGSGVRERQLAMEEKERQAAAAEQMRTDLTALAADPSPQKVAAMSLKYPQLSEQFKRSYDMLTPQQQQAKLATTIPVYAAVQSGRYDVAAKTLRDTAQAMENSGQADEAARTRAMADLIEQHPETAKLTTGLLLSNVMGPEKFAETFGKLGQEARAAEQAPFELRSKAAGADKAESDAKTAKIDADLKAKYGEQSAMLDIQKKGWDIKAIQEDIEIKKQANRIAAMNAKTSRLNSDTQRQELQLKIKEAQGKLDEKVREKVGRAESAAADIDNAINTIERIKKNPSLNAVLGSLEGNEYYPNSTLGTLNPLGSGDERSDAIALIETLGSQAFLSQVPKMAGMGQLTEREGAKLESALTNLSRKQSEAQFRANLDEASRLLNKGRENLSRSTGVPLGKLDTPAKPGARPPLESFNR